MGLLSFTQNEDRTQYFPKKEIKPKKVPNKKRIWVFILAGQSNMAGLKT